MSKVPVILIIDVGKTNKKLFLFDEHYRIVYERSARYFETTDEDGEPCENLDSLRLSVFESLNEVLKLEEFDIRAINFSAYGASLVYMDETGRPLTPLYNYLKPYPVALEDELYDKYGSALSIALETASPPSGSLNSGLQLYRIKKQRPEIFRQIRYALHLPQYLSFLITGEACSDITSIGCHTQLWHFAENRYHDWVRREGLDELLAPIFPSDGVIGARYQGRQYQLGFGLHDSSAALIPYLVNFREAFVLLSTGTWCVSMNPFNSSPLTPSELQNACLAYMTYQGRPVKSSRVFAGNEHDEHGKRIAAHFQSGERIFRDMDFEPELLSALEERRKPHTQAASPEAGGVAQIGTRSVFADRDLTDFKSAAEAYHQLIYDLVDLQAASTRLIISGGPPIRKIFVDGGFSRNAIFMNLLARAFPDIEVFAAGMAQASALGAAVAIHKHWNTRPLVNDMIELKYYSSAG